MTITNLTYTIYINFAYQLVFQTRSNIKTSNSGLPSALAPISAQDLVSFCFRTSTLEWDTSAPMNANFK